MSAQGVSTEEYRFTLVEKTASEVGDGKPHCMRATADQVAEVFYRVQDAEWTAGSITADTGFGTVTTLSTPYNTPTAALVDVQTVPGYPGVTNVSIRGYTSTLADAVSPDDPTPANAPSGSFGTPYYVVEEASGSYYFGVVDAANEYAIWVPNYTMDMPVSGPYIDIGTASPFRTGFSFYAHNWDIDPPEVATNVYNLSADINGDPWLCQSYLNILDAVAWVDVDGSGNPFSPGNELYIGVDFAAQIDSTMLISTLESGAYISSGINLELELANSVVISCPIYHEFGDGSSPTSASNFRLKANKWFPQAKNSPPTPVWNTATGVKL